MRFWLIVLLSIITTGCGTISPRTEREIALLRAEILDQGDQYAELKSRYRRAVTELAACRGEDVGYIPELDPDYYPESRAIGSGIIHTGTPDCCDECSQLYEVEYVDEGTIIDQSILHGRQPMNLDPQPRIPTPAVDPITSPFDESQPRQNSGGRRDSDSTMRSNLPMEHRFLASENGENNWSARQSSNELPDVEPSFRPETDGTQWRKTSAINSSPLSTTPIDDRYLDESFSTSDDFSNVSIQQVLINPTNTFAKDYDQDGGDDGVQLLIQPLDAQGRVIARASDVVVSIIDAKETGEAQRIGLWKLESYQVESYVSNERGREGLLLDLPWQRRVPTNRDLIVFVRYTTASGKKLETSLDIEITPPLTDDIRMLDSVADQTPKVNEKSRNTQNANMPQWRPVR